VIGQPHAIRSDEWVAGRSFGRSLIYAGIIATALAVGSWRRADMNNLDELPRNFHAVEPGRFYRSGQPEPEQLDEAIRTFGIRTVLNLRGPNAGQRWYDGEKRVCRDNDVTLLDRPLSSQRIPNAESLAVVLADLKSARYPLMVHCDMGADRTGLVTALYRIVMLDDTKPNASRELAPEYWHYRSLRPCMDAAIERFDPADTNLSAYDKASTQPCD
jgi:protein tyrosine/serine phosphatase